MDLISIIVPVYNVEKYLNKCIESIICQTYTNLQIILVDDGSTDESGKICDEYAKKDERIQVIHQKNGGVSKARNCGLATVKGKFVAFCDADDWIEPDMYEYLRELLGDSKYDIASCGAWMESSDTKTAIGYARKQVLYLDKKDSIVELHARRNMSDWMVTKLFKYSVVKDLLFDESLKVCEDYEYQCKAMEKSMGTVCGTQVKYHYIQRKESVSNNGYTQEFERGLNIRKDYMERYIQRYPDKKNEIRARYMLEVMGILTAMIKGNNVDKERLKELRKFIRKNLFLYMITKGPELYLKGSAVVICISFNMFAFVYRKCKRFT